MKIKSLISFTLLSLGTFSSFGWGQKGHDTIAFIAENHLTPGTLSQINEILDGKSIVYWANWLDNASHTPEYAYSKTWHYKNIDAGKTFEKAPVNKNGDIVTALNQQVDILKNTDSSKEDKALALKIVVHLLGDIHQPMHLGHASDLGGNRWNVKNFNRDTNLHSTWDSFIVEQAHKWSYTEWQNQIDRLTDDEITQILSLTSPEEWAKETFQICTKIYETTPVGTKCAYDYVAEWTPVVEQQFVRGGYRLANLLNSIFDK